MSETIRLALKWDVIRRKVHPIAFVKQRHFATDKVSDFSKYDRGCTRTFSFDTPS